MAHAGVPILYTSITDFTAFMLGASSPLLGISSFCIYAGVSILLDFFLQCTMFVAIMVWDARRKEARKYDCCCCFDAGILSDNGNVSSRASEASALTRASGSGAQEISFFRAGGAGGSAANGSARKKTASGTNAQASMRAERAGAAGERKQGLAVAIERQRRPSDLLLACEPNKG
jgi:hypothetical protein